MAKSVAQLKQERDQQAALLRSLPSDKDDAAKTVRRRITQLERQIQAIESPPPPEKSGPPWLLIILVVTVALIGLAFLGGYFGGQAVGG